MFSGFPKHLNRVHERSNEVILHDAVVEDGTVQDAVVEDCTVQNAVVEDGTFQDAVVATCKLLEYEQCPVTDRFSYVPVLQTLKSILNASKHLVQVQVRHTK